MFYCHIIYDTTATSIQFIWQKVENGPVVMHVFVFKILNYLRGKMAVCIKDII